MIYGNKFLSVNEVRELNDEEKLIMYENALELINELDDFSDNNLIMEGANDEYVQSLKVFKDKMKTIKNKLKNYKIRKDKDKYIKTCNEGIELCKETKKDINKISPTVQDNVISYIIGITKVLITTIPLIALSAVVATVSKTAGTAVAISSAIAGAKFFDSDFRDEKGYVTTNMSATDKRRVFNQYRVICIKYIYQCIDQLEYNKNIANNKW